MDIKGGVDLCMNKAVVIALYDSDREYIESFNEYLKEQRDTGYSIILFTDISALDVFCRVKKVDMIVIAEYLIVDSIMEEDCMRADDNIIILADDKDVSFINNIPAVYRYQSTDLLISSILNICADRITCSSIQTGYTKIRRKCIVSIYSPIGRCGKTLLSVRLGTELSERGLKVLLINLEEFSLLMKYLKSESSENLSDLLYYFLSNNQSLAIKAEAVIKTYKGLDYIPPVEYAQDIRKTDSETWKKFIDAVGEVKEYNIIILDISNMVEDVFRMLEFSDIVVMPTLDEEDCKYKTNQVKDYIKHSEYMINPDEIYSINMNRSEIVGDFQTEEYLMDKIESFARG